MAPKMVTEFIALSFVVYKEGDYYVSECPELGTSSFGENEDEALENLKDATGVYLNTLEELGNIHEVLDEKHVKVFNHLPTTLEVKRHKLPIGSTVKPTALPLEHVHA
ncbi:MAG: type II toxin-antitoxin system HicB family antitoxin [Burkholderiales bacterium]|nr:type II toxin-antitoxin system HicB family antitoxin [Burkholderiales bacterium]